MWALFVKVVKAFVDLFTDEGFRPLLKTLVFAGVLGLMWRWASQTGMITLTEVEVAVTVLVGNFFLMLRANKQARRRGKSQRKKMPPAEPEASAMGGLSTSP